MPFSLPDWREIFPHFLSLLHHFSCRFEAELVASVVPSALRQSLGWGYRTSESLIHQRCLQGRLQGSITGIPKNKLNAIQSIVWDRKRSRIAEKQATVVCGVNFDVIIHLSHVSLWSVDCTVWSVSIGYFQFKLMGWERSTVMIKATTLNLDTAVIWLSRKEDLLVQSLLYRVKIKDPPKR